MKRITVLLLFLLLFQLGFAQEKTLTLQEIMSLRSLYALPVPNLKWIGNSDEYCLEENQTLWKYKAGKTEKKEVISKEELNKALLASKLDVVSRFPEINWIDNNSFWFLNEGSLVVFNCKDKKVASFNKYDKQGEEAKVAPNTLYIAYVKENNVYYAKDSKETAITKDENKGIVNGKAAHRNEWGINGGLFWSNDGKKLAFYRVDETMVTDYPLVKYSDLKNRIAEVENTKYPMAGMSSHHATVGVFDTQTEKTIFLKTGEPKEKFLTNITWSPDNKFIYIAEINRQQTEMKLNKYNAETGDYIATLFEEKNDKYVEPENGLIFLENTGGSFLWFSKRDGWKHLWLYDANGKLIRQLTKGEFDVQEYIGYNPKTKTVYYEAAYPTPVESQLYSINIEKGEPVRITQEEGSHEIMPSANYDYFIDEYSSVKIPRTTQLIDATGKKKTEINKIANPLENYKKCEISLFTIKANDGSDLWCRLIKPADFNPNKKYPVFFYVYGGPHAQLVQNRWMGAADMFMYYMAQQGYVVFTLDNHGTPNRGLKFEQAIHRNLGTIEVEDQMKGVEYLQSLPWVDDSRMAIHGWSYGGFMTLSLMLKHPGTFKVAVAGGPVVDWKWYEVMYGERYMDTPEENPAGYQKSSLLNYVSKLKGKLLIIHGSADPTVVPQHSITFLKKCVDEGVQVDFFLYPDHEHNIRGKDRLHLYRKIEQYIKENIDR